MKNHSLARWEWILIVALLLIAFALRTFDLADVPYGLHNDEVAESEMIETAAAGRVAVFFPENTGSETLHYYYAAPFLNTFGHSAFALRLPAAFLSLIAMCVIWALARRLFGPIAALTTLAVFTVAFWPVVFGRIISHTIMIVPVAALAAYFFWRACAAQGKRALALWAVSGMWLGLSLLSYTAARILPVVFVAFGVYTLLAQRSAWRRWLKAITLVLFMAALVSAPLFIYLAENPAEDALGFFEIDRPLTELQRGNLEPVLETSLRTLGMFSFFGDPLPYYDVPDRPILEPIGSILLLLGVLIALRRWRQPEYAFALLWFFLALVPGMLSQPAPNWTRTLSAQVVAFAMIGVAVDAWVRRFHNKFTLAVLAVIFIGNLAWTARDYFVVWPSIDTVRFWHQAGMRAVADEVQTDPDTSPVVLCVPDHLVDEREPWWKPVWQHWRYLQNRSEVSTRFYNCVDTLIFPPGVARYAFPDAADDATLQQFPITAYLQQPDRIVLPDRLGVILKADPNRALERQLREVAHSPVKLDGSSEAAALPIDLGGQAEFLGYTLSQQGKDVALIAYWRATDQLPPQLSQFTHVLNDQGEIVAQQDRLMLTSQSLRAGDVFAQIHRLTLPENLPPGSYPIAIGLYTQPDNKRLPILIERQPRGDRIFLEAVNVP
jgi:4-amino-4-deoxy-L-arabinose transferase-like glycosyltransferase